MTEGELTEAELTCFRIKIFIFRLKGDAGFVQAKIGCVSGSFVKENALIVMMVKRDI